MNVIFSTEILRFPVYKQKDHKSVFKTNYRLMKVKSIAECSKGSILQFLSTFIKLSFVTNIYVLSMFEWPFYTDFTVGYSNTVVCLSVRGANPRAVASRLSPIVC